MRDFIAVNTLARFLICIGLSTILGACQSPETRQESDSMDVLAEPHIKPDIEGYSAELEVNNQRYAMDVNDYRFLTTTMPSLKPGVHQITRRYYANGTLLAQNTDTVKVLEYGRTLFIPLTKDNLESNYDDDADGWTNLAEANMKSDYQDPFSMPGGVKPGFAINSGGNARAHAAQYAINDYVGSAISSEPSQSKTYTLVHYY